MRRCLASQRSPADPLNVLLPVNIDVDTAKVGVAPDEVPKLLATVRCLPGLKAHGLMTVLKKAGDPDLSFARIACRAAPVSHAPCSMNDISWRC